MLSRAGPMGEARKLPHFELENGELVELGLVGIESALDGDLKRVHERPPKNP